MRQIAFLLALSVPLCAAVAQPLDVKLIEKGRQVSRTVAGIGCAGCHGPYGEGDVGIGPYIRGVGLSKIQAAIATVEPMRIVKNAIQPQDIEAVAAYYSWLGQHQLVKTLLKRNRFVPDAVNIYPGTAVQLAVKNAGQSPHTFAGPVTEIKEFQVPGLQAHELVWRAPEGEGKYTLRCVDCAGEERDLTINVSRAAKPYRVPDRDLK